MRCMCGSRKSFVMAAISAVMCTTTVQADPREHELKLPIGGEPGPLNAITDVPGVEVGHSTIISGEGLLVPGKGPVRTGVTVVLPRGRENADPVFGAWFTLNGNGEMTGTTWLEEGGFLEGPIGITNTHSVGVVRDAIIAHEVSREGALQPFWLPVVAETYDGVLNDINGFHVRSEHVKAALEGARGGAVLEGNVGGGTGMMCLGFKGGIGTASRKVAQRAGGYTVGVLVQCNFGRRRDLRIAGVPVGEAISGHDPCLTKVFPETQELASRMGVCGESSVESGERRELGSIIAVVATDAPLLPHQLKRLATRVSLGVGRQGGYAGNGSGDIFVAFSTANANSWESPEATITMLSNDRLDPLFAATVHATEAAITNAMLAAETMTGANGVRVYELPVERLMEVMRRHNRIPNVSRAK